MSHATLARRATAEFVGTFMLLVGVVGSGILVEDRAGDAAGVALLAHALTVAGVLGAAILALGKVSGAHFNPAVSLAVWLARGMPATALAAYAAAQVSGAVLGAIAAHAMFGLAPLHEETAHA
jgi:glycerol uptake facilitator-like aquaporin